MAYSVFEIRTFHLAGYNFFLQLELYEIALSWCLWWNSFPMCFLSFTKICLTISPLDKHPSCWSFKLSRSHQFKLDIKSWTWLTWNADMWLKILLKTACATLSPFQMLNQIAKFNSCKLIPAKWILHQRNINAITTCFKYLIWQFNSTS